MILKKVLDSFDLSEVSFHCGWIFYLSGPYKTNRTRKVMTVIYMDKNMQLVYPYNCGQVNDWNTCCPWAKIREVIETDLNPIIF